MKKRATRRLLFWTFIVLFLISAPLTVLYTSGYRLGANGVIRTGTLFVATTPRDVPVTLDGELWRDTTPTIIKTLLPGRYTVEIDAPGYLTWAKELEVESGQTTFADQIQLFLDTDPQLYLGENVHNASWSPSGNVVAWADHQLGWSEIWVSNVERPAGCLISRIERDDNVRLEWTDDTHLTLSTRDTETYIDTEGTISPEPPIASDRIALVPGERTTDVELNGNHVATLERTSWELHDVRGNYVTLHDPLNEQIALLNTNDTQEPLLLVEDAVNSTWSSSGLFAFHSDFGISVYDPNVHQTTLVTRISDRIVDVAWHANDGYLLYATESNAFVIERDVRDGRNVLNLGTFNVIESIHASNDGRTLYVVAERGFDRGIFQRTLWERPGICLPRTGCF